jgi:putative ABC transport system ATP-binding protein
MTTDTPLLRVDGLTKVFGEGPTEVRAVTAVDLRADRHEITLVMGPSGSGKTTLLTMLGCLLRPSSGTVAIDGFEVTGLRPREQARVRRTLVGFVFQTFNLLDSLTARENVEVALNIGGVRGPAAALRAAELLDAVGLARRGGFRAHGLSAGERQRVALARALANAPPLLLADEPTANLDTRNGRDVMGLLRELADLSPVGAVVVSHDDRLTAIADRLVRLEDGQWPSA